MKIASLTLLILVNINLYANENWIKIEQVDKTKKLKQTTKTDLTISQVQPISKLIKNAKLIKQLIDNTKKETSEVKDKNWFVLSPR